MRLVIAPDGFGGTLSPAAAARALGDGWSRGAPGDEVDLCPLSDGGPGLVEVMRTALPDSTVVPVRVEDALSRPVEAEVLLDGSTAYVESALACGLHLLAPGERDPRTTTTAGVGQLLLAALDAGATRVVVGLGGSATNDGGAGMLAALGLRAVDGDGRPVAPGGAALAGAAALEGDLDPRLAGVELLAATDVDSPLLGPTGASAVFGPQKGASPEDVRELDAALARWADLLEDALRVQVRDAAGAGAAGGLGAALIALGAAREPGIALVRTAVGLDRRVADAHLVLTGEGTLDGTSLTGKVVSGVAGAAGAAGVPCVVLAGQVRLGRREQAAAGLAGAYAVADRVGLEASMADPAGELAALAAQVAGEWSRG
jgi:glycerate 2-kinase